MDGVPIFLKYFYENTFRVADAYWPDGSFHPGVADEKMGNIDQVPVYIADHSKGTWGVREDHTRRMVVTYGK